MVIVSALADDQPTVLALIKQVDVAPSEDTARLSTVQLKSARAEDVATALKSALPQGMKVKITPVRRATTRSCSPARRETVKIVMEQIAKIDTELERPLVEVPPRQARARQRRRCLLHPGANARAPPPRRPR